VRKPTAFLTVLILAAGLGACARHNAKNVYACPNKGPGVGFKGVKSGKLTVQTALPAAGWWNGNNVDKLTGGYEFELAKDLCAELGVGRVRIVDVDLTALEAGQTSDFDLALAHIAITPERERKVAFSMAYFTSARDQQYGALLPKGSSSTKLVNTAISKLKASGALNALKKKWFEGDATAVPDIRVP
jgi:ABC-type amino acid transport substrate-binding protein